MLDLKIYREWIQFAEKLNNIAKHERVERTSCIFQMLNLKVKCT